MEALLTPLKVKKLIEQGNEELVIVDVRSFARYVREHLPGSLWFWIWDLFEKIGQVFKPKPPELMAKILGDNGISDKDYIIIYYDKNSLTNATYLAWFLTYLGAELVHIMSGGIEKWKELGFPLEKGIRRPPRKKFNYKVDPEIRANFDDILKVVKGEAKYVLLDVRSYDEYAGRITVVSKGGRIPGAIHTPPEDYVKVLENQGVLNPILKLLNELEGKRVIVYCTSGERASLAWFVLNKIAKISHVKLYPESLLEYTMLGGPLEK